MVKEFIYIKMELNIKENEKMISNMVKELKREQTEENMKESI